MNAQFVVFHMILFFSLVFVVDMFCKEEDSRNRCVFISNVHVSIESVSLRYSSDVNRLHWNEFRAGEWNNFDLQNGSILRCTFFFYLFI